MTSIKIVVPVHEEEGWTVRSPEGSASSVKARLQAKSPKSPETLKRIEERAVRLRQLHVEATQLRAAKENQRAKEVAAARRRLEASSRQSLLSRFEEQAKNREEKKRLAQQRLVERLSLRKSGAAAAHAARAAAQQEREHRAAVIRNREEECAQQAEKARQQMVQRVGYHFKQALAKATAVKEERKESLESRQEKMLLRLAAAEERREELAKETAAGQGPTLSDKAAHAQRVARRDAELKAERAQLAMAAAAKKREEALEARVRLQARLAPTRESKEAEKDRAEATAAVQKRRALFAKLNDADARRGLFLWRRVRESRLASMRKATQAIAATVIVVNVERTVSTHDDKLIKPAAVDVKAAAAAAAAAVRPLGAALLARLLGRPERNAVLHRSRELAAASRRALSLAAIRAKAAHSAECSAAVSRKRATRRDYAVQLYEAKMGAAAARTQKAEAAQHAARVARSAARGRAVAAARAAAREAELTRFAKAVTRQEEATARRGELRELTRGGGARRAAARAFASRRFAQDAAAAQRGGAEHARCVAAAGRRAALLSARVAKAELMAIPRGQPAKLSIDMNAAASAASPLVKLCVGPSAVASKQGGVTQGAWPRLASAVVAAAAAKVRRAGVFKRHEKTLEGWQLEGWTLVDHPENSLVDYYAEQSELAD